MLQAIRTKYDRHLFRSRLEARWAVFFNALNIKWEYEKEGYILSNGMWYLPDFWLPDHELFIEIKGTDKVSKNERKKAEILCLDSGINVCILSGSIGHDLYDHGSIFCQSYYDGEIHVSEDYPYAWHASTKNCGWARVRSNDNLEFDVVFAESNYIDQSREYLVIDAYIKAQSAQFEFGEEG